VFDFLIPIMSQHLFELLITASRYSLMIPVNRLDFLFEAV
jgi:hypothetical protein